MTNLRTKSARDRRAAMLRRAMLRRVRLKGRFRGQLLARLAHGIGRATREISAALAGGACVSFEFLSVPLNTLADQGTGRAGGGGGGSGRQ